MIMLIIIDDNDCKAAEIIHFVLLEIAKAPYSECCKGLNESLIPYPAQRKMTLLLITIMLTAIIMLFCVERILRLLPG